MSEIPLSALQALAGQISEKIEYWRQYEGQTVRIEYVDFTTIESHNRPVQLSHGVEGTIADVRSLPPGFILEDSVEFVHSESLDIEPVPRGGSFSDDKGKMFISFDSIERMVFED